MTSSYQCFEQLVPGFHLSLCVCKLILESMFYIQNFCNSKHFPFRFQNFNIYKRIFTDLINMKDLNKPESFRTWADLRDMFMDLVSLFWLTGIVLTYIM